MRCERDERWKIGDERGKKESKERESTFQVTFKTTFEVHRRKTQRHFRPAQGRVFGHFTPFPSLSNVGSHGRHSLCTCTAVDPDVEASGTCFGIFSLCSSCTASGSGSRFRLVVVSTVLELRHPMLTMEGPRQQKTETEMAALRHALQPLLERSTKVITRPTTELHLDTYTSTPQKRQNPSRSTAPSQTDYETERLSRDMSA